MAEAKKKWSRKHEKCVMCGTAEIKHFARGLCKKCYHKPESNQHKADDLRKQISEKQKTKQKIGRPIKWTPEKLEELGKELLDFVENTDALHISKFELSKGYAIGWLQQTADEHPSFSRFIKGARYILGNKLLALSVSDQKPHGWVVANIMPQYLSDIQDGRLEVIDKEEAIKHKYKAKEATQADERADRIIEALEKQHVKKDS